MQQGDDKMSILATPMTANLTCSGPEFSKEFISDNLNLRRVCGQFYGAARHGPRISRDDGPKRAPAVAGGRCASAYIVLANIVPLFWTILVRRVYSLTADRS